MNWIKLIFYVIIIIGEFLAASDYAAPQGQYPDDGVSYIMFTLIMSIFYWIYKIIRTLTNLCDTWSEPDDFYTRGANKARENYHKRYQPKTNKFELSNFKKEKEEKEKEIAQKFDQKMIIRNDIKISSIKKG